MMHITWYEIYAGLYEGLLFDGKTIINTIQFTDYSRKEQVAYDIKHRIKREGAYDVRYIGKDDVIRHFIFDSTEDMTKYGYNGTPKRTIETMKEWCEDFMKSVGIEQYVEDCSTTPEARWIRKENMI